MCNLDIDYVHPCSPFARMILGACFGPGPFALDMSDRDHDHPGTFLRTKSIIESSLTRLVKDLHYQLILQGRFISSLIGSKDLGILNCDKWRSV